MKKNWALFIVVELIVGTGCWFALSINENALLDVFILIMFVAVTAFNLKNCHIGGKEKVE